MPKDLNEWLRRFFAEPEPEPETVDAPPAAPCLPNPGEPIQIGSPQINSTDAAFLELAESLPSSIW